MILSTRMRELRLSKNWTRETLALRAGITISSLKRFETTGKASLELILKVSFALSRLQEFDGLFLPSAASSMKELEEQNREIKRSRGRI